MDWNRWMIAGGIILVIGAGILIARWLSQYARRAFRARLREIDQIVNQNRVPIRWLRPYLRQLDRLEERGGVDAQVTSLIEIARKRCLANIQELIRYIEQSDVARTEAAQHRLIRSLQEQAARWRTEAWEAQMAEEVKRWRRQRGSEEQ